MKLNWTTLIRERDEWVAKNFPPVEGEIPGNVSILGCIEEVGELAHAHLKREQGIRGSQAEHDAAAKDAIGDIVVYLLGVMSAHMTADQVNQVCTGRKAVSQEEAIFLLSYEVGLMAGTAAKIMTNSWVLTVNNILKYCEVYCTFRYWNFEEIVQSTWDHVKQRDWQAHRAAGAAKDDPAMKDPKPVDELR